MRVADYIFETLANRGAKHVFLVTGGGAMHLNDAVRCQKRLTAVCCHHEQGCAIAAEGYVRAGGEFGVVNVTSGPGGTNAMTGVIGQWLDSVPVIYISGQVKFETTIASCPELGLRQLGDQEINIVDIVRPVTKYAAMVSDPAAIGRELDRALFEMRDGRPGPVWLDIPLNVQSASLDGVELEKFTPPPRPRRELKLEPVLDALAAAKRPVIIAGHGIAIAGARESFIELAGCLGVPVVTTFNGVDLLGGDHELYSGRIGTIGQRAGNFVLQNADLVISLGSRNNIRQVSYDWKKYCRAACKIAVDIDPAELGKKTFRPDIAFCCDAGEFIAAMLRKLEGDNLFRRPEWLRYCRRMVRDYPTYDSAAVDAAMVDPYYFMAELTARLPEECNIVAGNGTACVALFQSGRVKRGQRMFWNSGCASMGYDLPAALGASVQCGDRRPTACLAGDGSAMMNLQELQTMAGRRAEIKIFLLDNSGYCSIKQTQRNFFGSELLGCDEKSGVSFPDFIKLGEAFGFAVDEIASGADVAAGVERVLAVPGPVLCVVRIPGDMVFTPKLSSKKLPDGRMVSSPLEDMYPFLERDEFKRNMINSPEEE